ncbi:MAG: NAD(+) synthase, partial [Clostridia bacterium]
ANASGIVLGNSGGKDSALVGILCKMACENTVGIILPCGVSRNFQSDFDDAKALAEQFDIETRVIDLSSVKTELMKVVSNAATLNDQATTNIAPRIRMTALYAVAASENRLVAGTGNRSERYVGYFTKWGDGAQDFNPISDLTATEVFEFLRFLKAPASIIEKAPSAGLKEGQTDENEMGVTYGELDGYIATKQCDNKDAVKKIERLHKISEHKRKGVTFYKDID